MDKAVEVIDYTTFMRASAEEIVARKGGHGCVNDYERMLRYLIAEDDYYRLAEMNAQCVRMGGEWYPHICRPGNENVEKIGVVMPGAV